METFGTICAVLTNSGRELCRTVERDVTAPLRPDYYRL